MIRSLVDFLLLVYIPKLWKGQARLLFLWRDSRAIKQRRMTSPRGKRRLFTDLDTYDHCYVQ